MSIEPEFSITDLDKYIQDHVIRLETAIINTYKFVGEKFVNDARIKTAAQGGFNDITGNLRSSIGYLIFSEGIEIHSSFEEANGFDATDTGRTKGISFAEEVLAEFPHGVALICVAGMEYAAAVEARGKDVITGSTNGIEQRIKTLLAQLR